MTVVLVTVAQLCTDRAVKKMLTRNVKDIFVLLCMCVCG